MAQHVTCQSCSVEVKTQVTSEVSCLLSCLVNCFPGFRKYTHTCPKCRAIIAQTEPKHTTCQLVTIILTSIGVIGLGVLMVYFFFFYLFSTINIK